MSVAVAAKWQAEHICRMLTGSEALLLTRKSLVRALMDAQIGG